MSSSPKTPFTRAKELIMQGPLQFKECAKCGVEFPVGRRQHYFRDNSANGPYEGWCVYCVRDDSRPRSGDATNFTIPPLEGEAKCQLCGHNYIYHQHNFDLAGKYRHPSGKRPCCRFCEGTERRDHYRDLMLQYKQKQASAELITSLESSNPAEAKHLREEQLQQVVLVGLASSAKQMAENYQRSREACENLIGCPFTDEQWQHYTTLLSSVGVMSALEYVRQLAAHQQDKIRAEIKKVEGGK